jgi:integrase
MLQVGTLTGPTATGEYLGEWLAHVRGRVRTKTYEGYEALIRRYALPAIGDIPLLATTPLDLQHLYSSLLSDTDHPISAGTVLNLHLVLTQAFGQAVRWGVLGSNPAAGAQPPRPRRAELAVVDAALAARILEAIAGHPLELPCAIAVATGMRRGEILGLRWADLDAEFKVAHIKRSLQATRGGLMLESPKTPRSRRAVELPQFLVPHLERQREDQGRRRELLGTAWEQSDHVVDGGDGSPLHPDALSGGWRRFLKKAGLPHVRFHDLRHAHATLMLLQGVHPKVVSERLGHASVGITLDTYSHVLPAMQEEAVRAFDELFATPAR